MKKFFKNLFKKSKPKKYKLDTLTIHFYDGSSNSYSQTYEFNEVTSAMICFGDFYKWFYNREHSEIYTYIHSSGQDTFKRSNIKEINFNETIFYI